MSYVSPLISSKPGNQRLTVEMKVTRSSTIKLQIRKGTAALNMATIDRPDILLAMLRHIPTGGVTKPMEGPIIRTAPN